MYRTASQGSLPKNVSWYRKHLALPADWEGTHIDIYVEGAYSVATYYLNGVLPSPHATGYTSKDPTFPHFSEPYLPNLPHRPTS